MSSVDALLDHMRKVIDSVPSEPLSEYMRNQGCDPADGWELILPTTMWAPYELPKYVKRSSLIEEPVFVNPRAAGLTP